MNCFISPEGTQCTCKYMLYYFHALKLDLQIGTWRYCKKSNVMGIKIRYQIIWNATWKYCYPNMITLHYMTHHLESKIWFLFGISSIFITKVFNLIITLANICYILFMH